MYSTRTADLKLITDQYLPGLHILSEFDKIDKELTEDYSDTKKLLYRLIEKYGLQPLGDVFYRFEGGGFTGIICLTESHIAIHTWPEFGKVTIDVFLSNYRKLNDKTARSLMEEVRIFFKCSDYKEREIVR